MPLQDYEIIYTRIGLIREQIVDLNLDTENGTSNAFLMRGYSERFHGNKKVVVAKHRESQQIVGWGYPFFQFSFFELGTYVLPEYRGNGLGKQIVLKCFEVGLMKNITKKFYFNTHSSKAKELYFSALKEYNHEIVAIDNTEWYMVRIKDWKHPVLMVDKK